MASVFKGIEIFSCDVCDSKLHCEFVLGQSNIGDRSRMVRNSGILVLGSICGVKRRGRGKYIGLI